MNPLQSSIVARDVRDTFNQVLASQNLPERKQHLGVVCVLYNTWNQSFRIFDWNTDQSRIEELTNKKDFRMIAWAPYRRTDAFSNIETRPEAVLTLRSKIKEMREDLLWLEASIERIERTGQPLCLPERPEYFHFNHGMQRRAFEVIEFGLANAKISGD